MAQLIKNLANLLEIETTRKTLILEPKLH